jgi:site-specific DNA recombinase
MPMGTKKCVAYCRVSSERQLKEGFSIPAQQHLIQEYADKHDFTIAKEFCDDESAGTVGRSQFTAMLAYIEKHKDIHCILVEKTDRLYRNFKDYGLIDDLKIEVRLIKENEIIGPNASAHVKLVQAIKVAIAKNYIDNLSEEIRKGYDEKLRLGMYPNRPMFGYRSERTAGKSNIAPHPNEGPVVRRMFELYATGQYSLLSMLDQLEKEGLLLTVRRRLTKSTMHQIFTNPVYYGDFLWKGELYKGIHEPLVSLELWNKVAAVMASFNVAPPLKHKGVKEFFLKGLLACQVCGRKLTAEKKKGKYVYYRCTKLNRGCDQKSMSETKITEQLDVLIKEITLPLEAKEYICEALRKTHELKKSTEDETLAQLKREETNLEQRLNTIYEDRLINLIDQEFYATKKAEFINKLNQVRASIQRMNNANTKYFEFGIQLIELLSRASSLYFSGEPEDKRNMWLLLTSNLYIKDQKVHPEYKKALLPLVCNRENSRWWTVQDSNL